MAIRYYDNALVEKVKAWVKDPKMTVLSPSDSTRFFQMRADQLDDKPIKLPLIAISRDSEIEIISTAKKALTYDAGHLTNDKNDHNKSTAEVSKVLNAIPIKLTYQLDIYTKYFAEADEYIRNFVFNFINYPRINIEIPYNDAKVLHNSTILLESSISDSSDIPERLIAGQFTRMTLRLTVDDAYLFSVPFMDNWKIESGSIEISGEPHEISKLPTEYEDRELESIDETDNSVIKVYK